MPSLEGRRDSVRGPGQRWRGSLRCKGNIQMAQGNARVCLGKVSYIHPPAPFANMPSGRPAPLLTLNPSLVVRLRSLPKSQCSTDLIALLIAQGIYRSVFAVDVVELLQKLPSGKGPENPVKLVYKPERRLWPVFAANLSPYGPKKKKGKAKAGADPEAGNSGEGSRQKRRKASDDDLFEAPKQGASTASNLAIVKKSLGVDYSEPAAVFWGSDSLRALAQHIGFPSLVAYDFRRSYAMNMRNLVSKVSRSVSRLASPDHPQPGRVLIADSSPSRSDATSLIWNT